MQNEELRRAQLELDEQREKYFELFDLAPGRLPHPERQGHRRRRQPHRRGPAGRGAAAARRAAVQRLRPRAPTATPTTCTLRALWKTATSADLGAAPEARGRRSRRGDSGPLLGALRGTAARRRRRESPSCWMTFTDVDESVAAREALQESRERLREAHRLAHIGVWEWDTATDTVTWTEELYRIAGPRPEAAGPHLCRARRRLHPGELESPAAAVEKALETGESFRLDLEIVRPDGAPRWVDAFGGGSSGRRRTGRSGCTAPSRTSPSARRAEERAA